MTWGPRPGALGRRGGAIAIVLLLHAGLLLALLSGSTHRGTEVTPPALEVSLLPPPEPPKVVVAPEPPKPVVKPEVVRRAPPPPAHPAQPRPTPTPTQSDAGITAQPEQPPAPPAPVVQEPQRVSAQVDAAITCRAPDFPQASRRAGETGTVRLQFLVDVDGQVVDSRVERSSGFERLDEAARDALSLCRFKPGTIDGRPERSWARLDYVWKLK